MLTPQQQWLEEKKILSVLCNKTTQTILSGPTTNTTLEAIRETIPVGMLDRFNHLTLDCTSPLEVLEKLVDSYEKHSQAKPQTLSTEEIANTHRTLATIKMNQWKCILFEAFRTRFSDTLIDTDIDSLDRALKALLIETQKLLIKQRRQMLGHRAGFTTMMMPQTLSTLMEYPSDSQFQPYILLILTMLLYFLMHHLGGKKEIPMQEILDQVPTDRIIHLMQETATKDAFLKKLNQMTADLKANLDEMNERPVTFANAYANGVVAVILNDMRPFFTSLREMLPDYLIFSLPIFALMVLTRTMALEQMEVRPNPHSLWQQPEERTARDDHHEDIAHQPTPGLRRRHHTGNS